MIYYLFVRLRKPFLRTPIFKCRKKVHSMVSIILMIENDSTPGGESENLKVKTNNCKLLESLSCDRLSSFVTVTEHARHSASDRWLFSLSLV